MTKHRTLLTVKEASQMLNVSANTLYDWRKKGYPPRYIKIGGSTSPVHYDLEDLKDFLKKHTVEPRRRKNG